MKLPQKLPLDLMQTRWASILDPIASNPLLDGTLLMDVELTTGSNAIDHKLGRKLIGWIVIGVDGVAEIYDTQADNATPQLTLDLTTDTDVKINLWVF